MTFYLHDQQGSLRSIVVIGDKNTSLSITQQRIRTYKYAKIDEQVCIVPLPTLNIKTKVQST